MTTIKDANMLREYYELLTAGGNDAFNQKIKASIREYHKHQNETEKRLVLHDTGDSFIEVVNVPDDYKNAEDFYKDHVYIAPFRTYYDCTGRLFSEYHKHAIRQGRRVIYHFVGLDV